jgi:hypothetical protein
MIVERLSLLFELLAFAVLSFASSMSPAVPASADAEVDADFRAEIPGIAIAIRGGSIAIRGVSIVIRGVISSGLRDHAAAKSQQDTNQCCLE